MTMKRIVPCLLMLSVCACVCFGSLSEADSASDGRLDVGEYDGSAFTLEGTETLIVAGGGAYSIDGHGNSYIEVQYTSTPLSNSSGIRYIAVGYNSRLLYLDGITEVITVGHDATAILKGGTISAVEIGSLGSDSCGVTIYCQPNYVMDTSGISGLWADGTAFDIDFVNLGSPYPATHNFVEIIEIPEPTTLALLGLGGFLIRRKK